MGVFAMAGARIHITGASCSGATTLGRLLADALGVVLVDTDDFYWLPTDTPYTSKRPVSERLQLIRTAIGDDGWVISGSLDGWGDSLVANADLIVFLSAPTAVRLARLKSRERRRFGDRIAPGGDMEHVHANFLVWSAQYEDAGFTGRSRLRHETWLAEQPVPVLELDALRPPEELAQRVLTALNAG